MRGDRNIVRNNSDNSVMHNNTELLFVYGTLRRACASGAHQRFLTAAVFVDDGFAKGKLYRVNYYPGFIADEKNGINIRGEIYAVPATAIAALDDYECIGSAYSEPQEYRREKIAITLATGRQVDAWIYLFNFSALNLEEIGSGDWCHIS